MTDARQVQAGDEVEVRSASGTWHRTIARSGPRYDMEHAMNKRKGTFLSIAVDHAGFERPVNWPAEDVRLIDSEGETDASRWRNGG